MAKKAKKIKKLKELVNDYDFIDNNNKKVKLSKLFGNKQELILIHNMGVKCTSCTMWADGFNGVLPHLESRAAFVIISPDRPQVQKHFAKSRNWKFKLVSAAENNFTKDMGFGNNEEPWPGVSAFVKESNGKIYRVSKDEIGPGDKYCVTWHLFDLLPKGANGWQPKYRY